MNHSKEMAAIACRALENKKGQDVTVIDISGVSCLADYFIICTGTSNTQVRALAEAVEEALSKAGEEPHHIEGHRGGQWTLLDYSAVVIHVFTEEGRAFYDLERLWSDAKPVDVSQYLTADGE